MAFHDIIGELLMQEFIENEERAEFRLHQRFIRDMSNPFDLPTKKIKMLFRFGKDVARIIIDMVGSHMQIGQRVTAVPLELKVLASLHFYGTGGYQLSIGQGYNFTISQPVMSRCLDEVTNIIYNQLMPNWIVFPNNNELRNKVINGFLNKYNFPQCLGAIDCTQIAIISPSEDYPALPYFWRKGYYSVNCQIIVDSNYNILNMNARFPGSTHDSAIWQASNIKTLMETEYVRGNNSFLIGDSGYPLQPFLLTPFENPPENTPESNYNYYFVRARNSIERLNGVLKSRFRCLLKHRVLNYDPLKAGKIIYSCGVSHNIARFYKDEFDEEEEIVELDDDNNYVEQNILPEDNWYQRGVEARNQIIQYLNR